VQVRFKSSPLGRQSHGHDPHNAFTLNAYGDALLVNCVYRDWHGSPFHTRWCWSTGAHNALLVDGQGQKPHSADPFGRIVASSFQEGADYVAGEAAEAYDGKLRRFRRHLVFAKPDLVVVADELEAARPATFQWRLHGLAEFRLDEPSQVLRLERDHAELWVNYVAPEPLQLRQWSGYEPSPDAAYLGAAKREGFPVQWHVEAGTRRPHERLLVLTVLRPCRKGQAPDPAIRVEQTDTAVRLRVPLPGGTTATVAVRKPGATEAVVGDLRFRHFAVVERDGRHWRLGPP
jgi:hypothetical protein